MPGATSGRKRSVLLLLLAVALALIYQYGIAPNVQPDSVIIPDLPYVGTYITDAWTDGCDTGSAAILEHCSGNAGVYRVGAATLIFFILGAIAAACKRTANREAWPAKYVLFIIAALAMIAVPNEPYFTPIFLNIARVGAALFVLVQQLILIDVAYNMNDHAVRKADEAEINEGEGRGNKWLALILFFCVLFFLMALSLLALLYFFFGACTINVIFITVTLILSILVTVAQLAGEEASLLTSSIIVAYASYLCLTAVSKNPQAECNPRLGERDILGIVLGIGFTLLSLAWTSYSFTAEKRVKNPMASSLTRNDHTAEEDGRSNSVKGIVLDPTASSSTEEGPNYGTTSRDQDDDEDDYDDAADPSAPRSFNLSVNLNLILALVTCFFSMVLTGWGSVQVAGDAANPSVSTISMWLIIAAQWIAMLLYLWTLVAPRLFPDRDFS